VPKTDLKNFDDDEQGSACDPEVDNDGMSE